MTSTIEFEKYTYTLPQACLEYRCMDDRRVELYATGRQILSTVLTMALIPPVTMLFVMAGENTPVFGSIILAIFFVTPVVWGTIDSLADSGSSLDRVLAFLRSRKYQRQHDRQFELGKILYSAIVEDFKKRYGTTMKRDDIVNRVMMEQGLGDGFRVQTPDGLRHVDVTYTDTLDLMERITTKTNSVELPLVGVNA